jgi:hypothetical protein
MRSLYTSQSARQKQPSQKKAEEERRKRERTLTVIPPHKSIAILPPRAALDNLLHAFQGDVHVSIDGLQFPCFAIAVSHWSVISELSRRAGGAKGGGSNPQCEKFPPARARKE